MPPPRLHPDPDANLTVRADLGNPRLLTCEALAGIVTTTVDQVPAEDGSMTYLVRGPLFFGSSNDLVERFDYARSPAQVVVDLTHAQIWDASTVAALDSIETKFAEYDVAVGFVGLD